MYVSLGNKTTEETTLVSMKGDTVTVGDVFDSLKGSSQTQQSVLSATLQKALEKEYGSKVSKEDVDKAYKQASEQYGDQFSQVLAAYGQQKSHTVLKSVHKNWLSMLLTKPHKKI